MHVDWKRLAWVIFVYLYTGLFFYNCLKPYNNWLIPYIYTIILILWLGYEYLRKHLFFQSGFLPFELYLWPMRALFALFFYSSFIIGIVTVIWWQKNQMGLYPFIQIVGVAVLLYSIYLRWQTLQTEAINRKQISNFYLSIILLITSLILGYGSIFLIGYVVIIGLPLLFWNYYFERERIAEFETFIQKINKTKSQDRVKLWNKFIEKKLAHKK